jgi:glycosyltransferase involved in cell wall biosynthesis
MNEWVAFPGARHPRLWIGPGDTVNNGLRLYGPYSRYGIAAKRVLCALPESAARRVLAKVRTPTELARMEHLAAQVRALLNEAAATVSLSPGTTGPDQKLTAQVTVRGQVIAYVKLAETAATAALLRQERDTLVDLQSRSTPAFAMPRLLAFREDDALTALAQSAAPAGSSPAPLNLSAVGVAVLRQLASFASGQRDLAEVLDPAQRQTTGSRLQAYRFLKTCFSSRPVRTAFAHGDLAPWNLLCQPDGVYYLFDWEYARPTHPLLTDLLHYLFMPACLICRQEPRGAVDTVSQRLCHQDVRSFLQALDIGPEDVPAYFLLYLLGLERRHVRLGGRQQADFLGACLHRVLLSMGHRDERPRVLVSAYACEPCVGSEPGVGWQMVQAISARHEAWVMTRKNNQAVIERALATSPNSNLHFVYVDLPRWARFWKKGDRGVRTYYYLWQLRAWWDARRLCREVRFDLSHHVTFVNDWLFTFLALLPLPFIWGPIGSHPLTPRALAFDRRSFLADQLRFGFQHILRVIDPLFWLSLARATLVIGIDRTVFDRLPLRLVSPHRRLIHTAIGVEQLVDVSTTRGLRAGGINVLSVGRLVPIKGFHLTIAAFARLAYAMPHAHLVIIGNGFLLGPLQQYARKLNISDRIEFRKWGPRQAVLSAMREADVFLFPSFEGGGMVVLEAFSCGLPVVCLDYGGPGAMMTRGAGIAVTAGSKEETVATLTDALTHYAAYPDERRGAGAAARRHVSEHYFWSSRAATLVDWYTRALVLDRI